MYSLDHTIFAHISPACGPKLMYIKKMLYGDTLSVSATVRFLCREMLSASATVIRCVKVKGVEVDTDYVQGVFC